jgi:hypothetical protein
MRSEWGECQKTAAVDKFGVRLTAFKLVLI